MTQLIHKYQDAEGTLHEAIRGRHTSKCGRWVSVLLPAPDSLRSDCIACLAAEDRPMFIRDLPPMQNIPRNKKR